MTKKWFLGLAIAGLLLAGRGGQAQTGWNIPPGSLDAWYAACQNSINQRVEIVCIGDSTTFGSHGANNCYSWAYRIRQRANADGYADGGIGCIQGTESGPEAPTTAELPPIGTSGPVDNLKSLIYSDFAATYNTAAILPTNFVSTKGGQTCAVRQKGTTIRLIYGKGFTFGRFSYQVDGEATKHFVDCSDVPSLSTDCLLITGLADTLHTIKITNEGLLLSAPSVQNSGDMAPAATGLQSGTYYYLVTSITPTGESNADLSKMQTVTVSNGPDVAYVTVYTQNDATGYNLYRATSLTQGGQLSDFHYLRTVSPAATYTRLLDDNTDMPRNMPPVVNTNGLDTYHSGCAIFFDFMRDTGLVWHRNETSGASFAGANTYGFYGGINNFPAQIALGLQPDGWRQQIAIQGVPSGGNFALSTDGGMTFSTPLPIGADGALPSPAQVQAALGSAWQVTLENNTYTCLARLSYQPALIAAQNNLTAAGGSTPGIDIAYYFPIAERPRYRNPTLAICALGINDQQGGETDVTPVTIGLTHFILWTRAAGAVPLVVIPHYLNAASPATAQPFIDAEKAVCATYGVAWCDFNVALGPPVNKDPHLAQESYNREGDYLWDNVLKPANGPNYPFVTIGGSVQFDGLLASAYQQNVTFQFRPLDGTPAFTRVVQTPASGAFTLPAIPQKDYQVWIKADKYLAKVVSVIAENDVTDLTVEQVPGDVNGDNQVDLGDFGLFINAFDSSAGVVGDYYDANTDFNCDGTVDILDFGMLVNAYGAASEP